MRNTLFLIAFAWLMVTLSVHADDELISIDAAEGMITIQQRGALKTFRIKPFTDITINGQKAAAGQLRAGMQVTLGLADGQTASKVTARGNPGPAPSPATGRPGGTPAGTPAPFFANRPSASLARKMVIKALIDGGDNVVVQDGKLHLEHLEWSKPKDITVNTVKWNPEWNGNNSGVFTGFVPPLAPFGGGKVEVKMIKGRGDVTVLEPPTEANGQKLVVHLQDTGNGAREFEVRITW